MKAVEEKLKKEEKKKQGGSAALKPVAKSVAKPKATEKKVPEKKEIKLVSNTKKKKQEIENK